MSEVAELKKDNIIEEANNTVPAHLEFTKELQRLARESLAGDKKSYKIFLDKLLPHVRRYVRKQWWGDDNSEEDLVQDVMIAVHTNLHTYDPQRPLLPWLRSIVTYKVSDFLRKFSRWNMNELGSENIETFAGADTNTHDESIEHLDFIEKAFESLPEKQAHIVRMLKVHGMSLKEVSEQTGLSVAAVKTYAHRAYKKMLEFRDEHE